MKYTSNYTLKKPELTDIVNIDDFNTNVDKIDIELKKINDNATTLSSQLEHTTEKINCYSPLYFTIAYNKVEKIEINGKQIPLCSMEYSLDGINFERIYTSNSLLGQDFSVYFKDNTFFILTFTKNSGDFGLYKSTDLVNFEKFDISAGIATEDAPHVWFGQWFSDSITGKLYIVYSAQNKTNPTIIYNSKEYVNMRLGIVEVLNLEPMTLGTPRQISLTDNNRYDGFITEKDSTYYLVTRRYIDEGDNSHEGWVEIWSSTDLYNWEKKVERIQVLNNSGYEAMSISNDGSKYYMYLYKNLDYAYSNMVRIESTDLLNWSNKIELPPTTLLTNEMGTVHFIENQDMLRIIYNIISRDTSKDNIIRPTNYLKLEQTRTLVWRNLDYPTETLKILSAEDIVYTINTNVTDIFISNVVSDNKIPHRFFIRSHTGDLYYTIKSGGNIYLPDELTELKIKKDIICEFVYDSNINKYILICPSIEFIRKMNARKIILNDLATDGIIDTLELENNCTYVVEINTKITINNFVFKNNFDGEFNVYFLVNGEESEHYTSLTLKNNTPNILLAKYNDNDFFSLISSECGNRLVNFKRSFGKGQLQLVN